MCNIIFGNSYFQHTGWWCTNVGVEEQNLNRRTGDLVVYKKPEYNKKRIEGKDLNRFLNEERRRRVRLTRVLDGNKGKGKSVKAE